MSEQRTSLLGTLKLYGLPWHLFLGAFVIMIFAAIRGALTTDMVGTIALCIAIGGAFDEIGERIPVWNSCIGGGSGDLAVLGAADRMDLMAYAQLSSRLGGGSILVIASFVFSFLL